MELESPTKETGYSGNTTPDQDEALKQVRENIKDVIYDHYDDVRLLRFLRARAFDIKAAELMLRNDIAWRKEHQMDDILTTFPKTPFGQQLIDWFPSHVHKTDKYGLPLQVDRIAQVDPKSLLTAVPTETLLRMRMYFMERADHAAVEASKKAGKPLDFGIISIMDVEGLGWKHMYTPGINLVKGCLAAEKDHYPELIRKLFIVGCPRIFGVFWALFKPILDARTVEKTEIHTGNDFWKYLSSNMDANSIPDIYGGQCPDHKATGCLHGGGEWKGALISGDDSKPIEVTVKARNHVEIPVHVDRASSSIALEFKVISHDIQFKVLRQKSPKEFEEIIKQIEVSSSEPYQNNIQVDKPGTYIIHFDNSHSLMRSKQIEYQLSVISPGVDVVIETPTSPPLKPISSEN